MLALILRDAMSILRLVNLARSALSCSSSNVEAVTQLRDGLLALSRWVDTECEGYRPFMGAIYGQIGSLTKLIIPSRIQNTPPSSSGIVNVGGHRFQSDLESTEELNSVKSPPSSVSPVTPLEIEEILVLDANGRIDANNSSPQSETESTPMDLTKQEPIHEGSSCVIS